MALSFPNHAVNPRDPIYDLGTAWSEALTQPWFMACMQLLFLPWLFPG